VDPFHPPADLAWLARHAEPALEPELPIVDAHHHLFDRPAWRYVADDLRRDLSAGHRVVATVYLQCGERYRSEGPEAMRPVGETEFVEALARDAAAGAPGQRRLCAAIVGHADLMLGAAVEEVLAAHLAASPSRFRGIRHSAAWEADPAFVRVGPRPGPGLLREPRFREGFARLARHGLGFDAWLYHPQLDDLIDLAQAFPDTPIVLDHVGGPLGLGGYAGRRDEVHAQWRAAIGRLSKCPNVTVKLGGMGMRLFGFGFHERPLPPDSAQLAQAWKPYVDACIDAFGVRRCMFESNFPVDQVSCSYVVLWNAFKRLAAGCSAAEKAALFSETAARVYRIELPMAESAA
jgi:predicted TIM-barrel fold metal-dependent hydrolase